MATPSPTPTPSPDKPVRLVPREEPATGPLAGEPALVALPSFIVGAVAFSMVLIGVVPATAVGASMAIVLTAAIGMFVATIWAVRLGESAQAGINAIVGGFFLSYALFVLGLIHSWYGLLPTAVASSEKLFTISWIVVVTLLVLATLRLPVLYTTLFVLIDAALVMNLLGIIQTSENLTKAAGWFALAGTALVVYMFFSAASHATGGKEFPMGRGILHT